MRKGYLTGSIVFLVLAVLCIGDTVYQVVMAKCGMGSLDFWGSVAAHAVMALIGAVLLVKARPSTVAEGEGESGPSKEADT